MDSIGGKMMCSIKGAVTRGIMLCLILCAATQAWANFTMTNPVTGDDYTEYVYKYVGTGTWDSSDWQDSNGAHPNIAPALRSSGVYSPLLIDKNISVVSGTTAEDGQLEGWNLRIGAFGGAQVTLKKLWFWKGGGGNFAMVDADSKIVIEALHNNNNWDHPVNYYVAAQAGITYKCDFNPLNDSATINYYLKDAGSVVYDDKDIKKATHVIKRADVELSHPVSKQISNKKLVSFKRSDKTFKTASDSVVYVDGNAVNFSDQNLPTAVSITKACKVGTCQLVQRNDNPTDAEGDGNGIYLYYVDGPVEEDVTITSPFDGSSLASPSFAAIYSTSTTSISFGEESLNASTYQQTVDGRTAVVAKVTGGEYTDINGFMRKSYTTSNTNKDVFVVVSGATAKRINGVQEAHWSGNTRRTRTEGNSIVQVEDGTTVAYVMGAGYKGGRMPATVDGTGDGGANAQVQGNTGVTIKGGTVTGTVVGGWTAAHQGTPTVTGNTAVRIETVLGTATAAADDVTLVGGYIVGGSMYQANSGTGTSVGGNSSVTLALEGKSGDFDRIVVGGSLRRGTEDSTSGTQAVVGNSSVSVVASDAVRFQSTATIIGGGALLTSSGSGSVTVGGNASVSINGGTYLGTIVAGGYSPNGGTASVAGTATLTLNSGVFTGAILMGGNANGNKILTLGVNVDASDVASVAGFNVVNVGTGSLLKMSAIPTTATIASGATLKIINDETSLEIGDGLTNNGTLDLSGCDSLVTITAPVSMLGNITFPESIETVIAVPADKGVRDLSAYAKLSAFGNNIEYRVCLAETKAEYGAGSMVVSNVASDVGVRIVRPDGSTIDKEPTDGNIVLDEDIKIDGAAAAYDVTFTNTVDMAYEAKPAKMTISGAAVYNGWSGKDSGIMMYNRPWLANDTSRLPSGANAYALDDIPSMQGNMTIAVVGQMSQVANTIFLHFGHCSDGYKGILISRTANVDEVLVGYNNGSSVNELTKMAVPNCANARHVYVITKQDSDTQTTFTIYLDGVRWKTTTVPKVTLTGGVQIGADYGNNLNHSVKSDNPYETAQSGDTGYVNLLRLYDRILTADEIKRFSDDDEYPYESPSGKSTRTFSADATWIDETPETTVWTNTKDGSANSGTPDEGAQLEVTASADDRLTITVNLANQTAYESLTVEGSQTVTLAPSSTSSGAIFPGKTVFNTPTVIKAGAMTISGGPTFIGDTGSVTFDYSEYDALQLPGETTIQLSGEMDRLDAKVTIILPGAHAVSTSGYSGSYYYITVTPQEATLKPSEGEDVDKATVEDAFLDAMAGDTIQINRNVSVNSLTIDKNIEFSSEDDISRTITGTITIAAGKMVTLTSAVSLATNPVTVDLYEVVRETVGGKTTYTSVKKPGTIFSVW